MALLLALDGPNAGKTYSLTGESIIGRSYESDIYLSDLNVSRSHARILVKGAACILEDMGSGNGTYVNDEQIQRPYELVEDDVVRVGGSTFRFQQMQEKLRKPSKSWYPEVLTVVADGSDAMSMVEVDLAKPEPPSTAELEVVGKVTSQINANVIQSALAQLGEEEDLKRTEPRTDPVNAPGSAGKMLEAMYAVADAMATEMELEKLLDKILDHLFDVFPQAERGFVLLVNPKTGQLVPEAVKQRQGSTGGLQFSQTMVRDVMDGGEGVIRGSTAIHSLIKDSSPEVINALPTPPTGLPERRPGRTSKEPKIGSPLTCGGESLGTITLEGAEGSKAFSKEDLDLLSAIARQAAMAIANARTTQALMVQSRLESDLSLAREIQKSFLPHRLPSLPDLKVGAHYESAFQVGGDFYDIIKLGPSRLGIVVGDISGKGVSAALMMAKMITDIRLLSHYHQSPGKVLTLANKSLQETGQPGMFCTVLYILLDLGACTYTLANAGHQPPLIASPRFEGTVELDEATAVALGILDGVEYPEKTYKLVPGDSVVLYTDGINEAMSPRREEYGMERLRAVVTNGPSDAEHIVGRVVADVRRFVRGAPQSDDQTIVAFSLSRDLALQEMDQTLKG